LIAVGALGLAASLLVPAPQENGTEGLQVAGELPHVDAPAMSSEPLQEPAWIVLGDTGQRVVELAGMPIIVNRDVWEYGPSHLRLRANRVVDWYSSPLRPLPVASERPPQDEADADAEW
jgi:hypothetical protein